MDKINVEKLEELGIFEIRNLAREVGVYSPTTLKKQELIEKILKVIEGKEEPYIKKTKQGRPPKNINSINNLVDVIVPSKIFDNKKNNLFTVKTYFNDLNESLNVNMLGTNETPFKCLIKVYDNNEYALGFLEVFKEEKNKVVFINKKQVEFYELKTGDEIAGKYVFINEDKPFVLKEIYSINGKNFSENYQRFEDFNLMQAQIASHKLKMSIYRDDEEIYQTIDLVSPFAKGQRVLLNSYSINNSLNYQIVSRLTTSTNNLQGLAILIDEMPEFYCEINNNSRIKVISNNYHSNGDFKLELEIKLAKLKRMVESGDEVILFVNDINKLNNYLINSYILESVSYENAIIFAEQFIKDIILLGKYTKKGNLTTICGTLNSLKNNEFDNKYLSLFTNIICYKKDRFEYKLDLNNCSTLNIENILTKAELSKLIEMLQK